MSVSDTQSAAKYRTTHTEPQLDEVDDHKMTRSDTAQRMEASEEQRKQHPVLGSSGQPGFQGQSMIPLSTQNGHLVGGTVPVVHVPAAITTPFSNGVPGFGQPKMDQPFLDALRYQSVPYVQQQSSRPVLGMGYAYQTHMQSPYDSLSQKTGRYSTPPLVNSFGGKIRSSGSYPFGNNAGLGRNFFGTTTNATPQDVYWHYNPGPDIYSRKVFVGGLPIDIDEDEINATFSRFGPLVVDWPHKSQNKAYFPPKGYVFLIFEHEPSVQSLVQNCHEENDKYYICVSSPTMRDKPVQVRPWRLADADFVVDASLPLDPRRSVFIGGVPRPLKAVELAHIMDRLFGGVCYSGIDTDPELKYPKGAGRVAFSNQQSYTAAITARFVQLQHGDVDKRVEVKPYVLDDQMCDECHGGRCGGKYAPFFCANVSCLQYFCEPCWATIHSRQGREYHKPLVKESTERSPRGMRSGGWNGNVYGGGPRGY